MRSIRSFNRARTDSQRGFALISAIILAILYFALMQLMMIDATRALKEAQRYRSKVIASTLAESAAELSARQMITFPSSVSSAVESQGTLTGRLEKFPGGKFELTGQSTTSGIPEVSASCLIEGHIDGVQISIDWFRISQ